MTSYTDDQMLMLSGIQHFVFCARQWALSHIDQIWEDNVLTVEGSLQHEIVDNPEYRQMNGGVITLRGLRIASYSLGLSGIADAVELHPAEDGDGIGFDKYPGRYIPYPIEYKHGSKKRTDCDIVQLVAQAMCMEEMYGMAITEGALMYRKTHRKINVSITEELRQRVRNLAGQMHECFDSGTIPMAYLEPKCGNCSLSDRCMPLSPGMEDVKSYLKKYLYESPA